MAKQTFTVGQVLTAAQLTSLQQTAMSGGAASAKTASYTLVAADAGTAISMTSTSATTVTVNTGLFAAGDTVFIQNLGSGNLTITAGTATVNTAGSLILPQYDAGILYFVSASSAIFYDYIQVGAASPLTTKGDVYTFSTSDARLGVGANNTVLTADSAEATGLKWAAPAGANKSYSLLNTGGTTLSGTSTTISGISGQDSLIILITGGNSTTTSARGHLVINGLTGSEYRASYILNSNGNSYTFQSPRAENATDGRLWQNSNPVGSGFTAFISISGGNTTGYKDFSFSSGLTPADPTGGTDGQLFNGGGIIEIGAAITSVGIRLANGTFSSGTIRVYGSVN